MLLKRTPRYLLKHPKAQRPHKYLDIFANLGRPRDVGGPRTQIPSISETLQVYG